MTRTLIALLMIMAALLVVWLGYRVIFGMENQVLGDSPRSAFSSLADSGVEDPVVGFGQYFDIVSESTAHREAGVPVHQVIAAVPKAARPHTDAVQAKYQMSVLEGGCEVVALEIALDAMGFDADSNRIADNYLDIDGHFATGYSGDPYGAGGGYPPGIVKAANAFLADEGSSMRAYDLTGASFDDIRDLVQKGYPVLVWSTMGFGEPEFTGAVENGLEWYDNEHCVVLYGFEGDHARVSDPLGGLVTHDAASFQRLYEACGSMAAVVC